MDIVQHALESIRSRAKQLGRSAYAQVDPVITQSPVIPFNSPPLPPQDSYGMRNEYTANSGFNSVPITPENIAPEEARRYAMQNRLAQMSNRPTLIPYDFNQNSTTYRPDLAEYTNWGWNSNTWNQAAPLEQAYLSVISPEDEQFASNYYGRIRQDVDRLLGR